MKYIFDTSAVIYLFEKCRLIEELLTFSKRNSLCIPQRVEEEFLFGNVKQSDKVNLKKIFKVTHVTLDSGLLPYFGYDDSDGAIWVISQGLRNSGSWCVIDEIFGRDLCKFLRSVLRLKLRFTGTIGVLKRMKTSGALSQEKLKVVKDTIKQSSFYFDRNLLNELEQLLDKGGK